MSCPKHPGADTIRYKTAKGKRCSICAACLYSRKKKMNASWSEWYLGGHPGTPVDEEVTQTRS